MRVIYLNPIYTKALRSMQVDMDKLDYDVLSRHLSDQDLLTVMLDTKALVETYQATQCQLCSYFDDPKLTTGYHLEYSYEKEETMSEHADDVIATLPDAECVLTQSGVGVFYVNSEPGRVYAPLVEKLLYAMENTMSFPSIVQTPIFQCLLKA